MPRVSPSAQERPSPLSAPGDAAIAAVRAPRPAPDTQKQQEQHKQHKQHNPHKQQKQHKQHMHEQRVQHVHNQHKQRRRRRHRHRHRLTSRQQLQQQLQQQLPQRQGALTAHSPHPRVAAEPAAPAAEPAAPAAPAAEPAAEPAARRQRQQRHHPRASQQLQPQLGRSQPARFASQVNEGDKVYVYKSETLLPAYDGPRFAPLRELLRNLALRDRPIPWSEKHHVVVPSGGRGQPTFRVWVKKIKSEATSDVWMAEFRFRFDDSASSPGFSIDSLRAKLGDVTCAEAGLEWLFVADAKPQHHGIIQGEVSRPFIVAQRYDELFEVDLWLYVDEVDRAWGLSPAPPAPPADDREALAEDAAGAQEVEGREVEASTPPSSPPAYGPNSKPPSEAGSEDGPTEAEERQALRVLGSVPLKIMGALYALGAHAFPRGTTRDELAPALKRLGILEIAQTLQPARVARHSAHFLHNGERGAKTRLALTGSGVALIEQMYDGYEDRRRTMVAVLAGASSEARALESARATAAELKESASGTAADQARTPPGSPPPPPPPPSSSGASSPELAPFVSGCASSNEVKRALDDLDAAIANAQGMSKHLRLLLDRVDVE